MSLGIYFQVSKAHTKPSLALSLACGLACKHSAPAPVTCRLAYVPAAMPPSTMIIESPVNCKQASD